MDEALVRAALDLSGRPFLVWKVAFPTPKIGSFDVELVREFFTAFAMNGGITLNVALLDGANSHHIAEACFKAVARALREAVEPDPRAERRPLDQGDALRMTTAIVDYASGNLHSAAKSFQRMADETGRGGPIVVTADPETVAKADRIVLPGVGAFADCRAGLAAIPGLFEAIEDRAPSARARRSSASASASR